MRRVLALVLAVFFGLGVACGDDGDGGGSNETVEGPEGFAQEKLGYIRVFCTCEAGGGELVPENNACVRLNLGTLAACEEQVLEDRWSELSEGGNCLRNAYLTARNCLLENACNRQGCGAVLQDRSERCPANVGQAFIDECSD